MGYDALENHTTRPVFRRRNRGPRTVQRTKRAMTTRTTMQRISEKTEATKARLGAVTGAVLGGVLAWIAGMAGARAAQVIVVASAALAGGLLPFVLAQRNRIRELQARNDSLEPLALAGLATSGFAHEVKNGLTVARGFAGLARRRADRTNDERLIQQVDAIERETDRMVRELRAFVRTSVDDRRFRPSTAAVPVALESAREVVRSVTSLLHPLAREREIALELDAQLPSQLAVDASALRPVLMNLLLNAVTHARGTITITAREALDPRNVARLEVAVEDDGPGIPDALRSLVFERGFTRSNGGSGVGLAFARERAERSGGAVQLASSSAGARFVATLPLHRTPPDEP